MDHRQPYSLSIDAVCSRTLAETTYLSVAGAQKCTLENRDTRRLECVWHSQDVMGRPVSTVAANTTSCGVGVNNDLAMWSSFPVAEKALSRECLPCCGVTDAALQKFYRATAIFRVADFPSLYDQLTASPQHQLAFEDQLTAEIGTLLQEDTLVRVERVDPYSTRRDLSVQVALLPRTRGSLLDRQCLH